MAKLTLDLNKFKAAGIYTVEFDASESITITTQTTRLVVGFSRKGPFNAPVFLRDVKSARKIFGEIDPILEKKGSFFHRSIETCLQTGPVFALNLLSLNNTPDGDKVDFKSYSLSIAEDNSETQKDLLSSFYNKERFWFADSDYFQAIVNNNPLTANKLMSFTNLGQRPISVITRKARNISGFEITARDFYGSGNVPDYIREFDFISDYFIDVIIMEGDWTNYDTLSADPDYSKFFDKNGIKTEMIENFIADENTTLIANMTGCIIPEFTDKTGTNQYIETIVNNSLATTGVFMTINKEAFDDYDISEHKLDLVGHSLVKSKKDTMNFLSYVSPLSDELFFGSYPNFENEIEIKEYHVNDFNGYPFYIKSLPFIDDSSPFMNTLVIPKPKPTFPNQHFSLNDYNELMMNLTENSLVKSYGDESKKNDFVKVNSVNNTGTSLEIVLSNPDKNTTSAGVYNNATVTNAIQGDNEITIEFTEVSPNIEPNDLIYIKGLNKYYVVETTEALSTPSNSYKIKLYEKLEDISGYESYLFYDKWLDENMQIDENEIINKSVAVCVISQHSDYIANILDTENAEIKKFQYIEKSSVIFDEEEEDINYIDVYPGNKLFEHIQNKLIINGDYISTNENFSILNYLSFNKKVGYYGLSAKRITQWADMNLSTPPSNYVTIGSDAPSYTKSGFETTWSSDDTEWMEIVKEQDLPDYAGSGYIAINSSVEKIEQNIPFINNTMNATHTSFRVGADYGHLIDVGHFLVVEDTEDPGLTKVTQKLRKTNTETGYVEYEIVVNEPVRTLEKIVNGEKVKYVTRFYPIPKIAKHLQFASLGGFKLTSYHMPGTPEQLWKILNVIETTNLGDTLVDKEIIHFRYLIDTFSGGLEPMCGPKVILSRLAKKRYTCMAIINAPSIAQFIQSTDPRFTDEPRPDLGEPKPVLRTEYIASGGNLSLGPSYRFSLPDDENGARFSGIFSPFLKIRENNKNKHIPPAADVSNNFIRKFTSGQPYTIVAGPRRGVLSNPRLVGLEYEYLLADREYLEPFGINPIITTRRTGPMIYGNQSAYQKTLTAFNNLHVRDLLITVTEAIEDVLSNYVFEYNDARTRLEIRTIVEGYLQGVHNAGGIFDFLVIMDDSNNTPEIIDQNIGIIDIGIEPARGMQKVINRITVLKTGAIAAGGFTIA